MAETFTTKSSLRDYGVERRVALLQDALVAYRMLRKRGVGQLLLHARCVALNRLHNRLVDRELHNLLPRRVSGEAVVDGLKLRTSADHEAREATPYAPVPSKTLAWALEGIGHDLRDYHFVDIGSGRGFAVVLAAKYSFARITGIEFARELHEDACANLVWARANGLIEASLVELRHESALNTQFPVGPSLFFLYNPFGDSVMRAFLDRLDASVQTDPRPVIVVYANPKQRALFVRPGVHEVPLAPREKWLIRLFSPFAVRVYAWDAPQR